MNEEKEDDDLFLMSWAENDDELASPFPQPQNVDFNRIIEMDNRALSIPAGFVRRPLFEVVRYLIETAENEVEVARVLFRWITAQNVDEVICNVPDLNSLPGDYACVLLQKVKNGRLEYSDIYRDMASYSNLECVKISGVRKILSDEPCATVCKLIDWTWVSVLLEGRWRLIDCSMGAIYWQETEQSVLEQNEETAISNNEEIAISNNEETAIRNNEETVFTNNEETAINNNEQTSLISFLNNFYFLTNPKELILSHFPDHEHWQLLAKPVKYAEFVSLPFINPQYRYYSVQTTRKDRLDVWADNGEVLLEFTFPHTLPNSLSYRLRKIGEKKYTDYKERLENDPDSNTVRININLPANGLYVIDMFGKSSPELPNTQLCHLCSYLIRCLNTDSNLEVFPCSEMMKSGPPSAAEEIGMIPVNNSESLVTTVDGKAEIVFNLRKPLIFDQKLVPKNSTRELDYNYALSRIENGQVVFNVTPPSEGDYCLKIYAKEQKEDGEFQNVCNYSIRCPDVAVTPFPKEASASVGVSGSCDRLGLKLISPRSAITYTPEEGRMSVTFQASKEVQLLPTLQYCNEEGNAEHLPNCVAQTKHRNRINLRLKFPKLGLYLFSLYGRNPDEDNDFTQVYNAFIHCDWPLKEMSVEPTYLPAWKPSYKLHWPEESNVQDRSNLTFYLTIPDAFDVVVNILEKKYHMRKLDDNLWECLIPAGSPKSVFEIMACLDSRLMSYLPVVKLEVKPQSIRDVNDSEEDGFHKSIQATEMKKVKWRDPPKNSELVHKTDDDDDSPPSNSQNSKNVHTSMEYGDFVMASSACEEFASKDYHAVKKSMITNADSDSRTVLTTKVKRNRKKVYKRMSNTTASNSSVENNNRFVLEEEKPKALHATGSTEDQTEAASDDNSFEKHESESQEDESKKISSVDSKISASEEISSSEDTDSEQEKEESCKKQQKSKTKLREKAEKKKQNKNYKERRTSIKNRLIFSVQRKDKAGLKAAIAEAQAENIALDSIEYAQALRTVSMLNLRDEIVEYIDKKDLEGIKNTLWSIETAGFAEGLKHDVAHARASIRLLKRRIRSQPKTDAIDIPTLAEIYRYRDPPPVVHRMFMAILLLLGIHEGITKKWKRCQQMCVIFGSVGLSRRLHHLKVNDVHPNIAARARQILQMFLQEEAESVSPGVGTLYRWTKNMIESVLEYSEMEDEDNPIEPASIKYQKQLFDII